MLHASSATLQPLDAIYHSALRHLTGYCNCRFKKHVQINISCNLVSPTVSECDTIVINTNSRFEAICQTYCWCSRQTKLITASLLVTLLTVTRHCNNTKSCIVLLQGVALSLQAMIDIVFTYL